VTQKIDSAIKIAKEALVENRNSHWVVGFSGGKDSTAVLKIIISAYKAVRRPPQKLDIIYCDTGVESILLDRYVKGVLKRLRTELRSTDIPANVKILRAPVSDRFFVKIIGRGYPPPTNSFRWCTKNLRIRPVSKYLKSASEDDAVVVLGMRENESEQRRRSVTKSGGTVWQTQREGKQSRRIFLPILNFELTDVWDAVYLVKHPRSIDPTALDRLYRNGSEECPVIKPPSAPPCASGRFGCWTCTVVRRDRSAEAAIASGTKELQPYLDFRNWLAEIRNDYSKRWPERRSGQPQPGPFTISARKEILRTLSRLERRTGHRLLTPSERAAIGLLWQRDVLIERELGIQP
jgi:DNA sulfur modification protein DndC